MSLADYDRGVRVAELREATRKREGYFLSELARHAQSLEARSGMDEVHGVIRGLTLQKMSEGRALFRLLLTLTPDYNRSVFISTDCDGQTPTRSQVMVHLWQTVVDHEAGYPYELEVSKAAKLLAYRVIAVKGEIVLWESTSKNMRESKL